MSQSSHGNHGRQMLQDSPGFNLTTWPLLMSAIELTKILTLRGGVEGSGQASQEVNSTILCDSSGVAGSGAAEQLLNEAEGVMRETETTSLSCPVQLLTCSRVLLSSRKPWTIWLLCGSFPASHTRARVRWGRDATAFYKINIL
jgi:hypothetical protein